jgi:hypothetical protein
MCRQGAPSPPDRSSIATDEKLERVAVSKRHPMFGALKGLVRIMPGTDLTSPSDPSWVEPTRDES